MLEGIKRVFKWLMGEAPEGQRKLVFCTRIELMLFVLLLLKPGPELGEALVSAMVTTGIIGVGGNGVEWVSKSFSGKKGS